MKNKYIAYLHSCGLSQNELTEIFSSKVSAKEFYEGLTNQKLLKFVKQAGRREMILKKYSKLKTKHIDRALEKLDVTIIVLGDENYPENLKNIPHTPYIMYVRGKIPKGDMFGVVGSRKISEYGKKVISKIVPEISHVFPIVSGGAAGCDSEAHKLTLNSLNITVVVVGTGIDQTYPVSNEKLFNEAVNGGGAIISIFRIGEPGNPYNFPVRNEIVVGLSKGILVVEAKEKSGSLITAGLALDLGKDLFSIPGEITKQHSGGTNALIKKGEAKCVTESYDILEEYDVIVKQKSHQNKLPELNTNEKKVYNMLSLGEINIDDIAQKLSLSVGEIGITLSMLELKGIIKKSLSGKYGLL